MTRILFSTLGILFALAFLTAPAPADTVTLKDGTKVEGTVTEETDEHVKVLIQVTPTIKDVKIIPRAEVASVSKLTEEDLAYQKVAALLPTPPLLTASEYETLIRSQPERFLNTYPNSVYRSRVEKVLATLKEEAENASRGAVKIGDEWISADERKRDPVNVDARILYFNMTRKAAAGDYAGALRDFDVLERDYPGTQSFVDAVAAAPGILAKYQIALNASLRDYAGRMEKRKNDLLLLPEHERKANEDLFKKEIENDKAAAERDKKLRWISMNPNSNYKEGFDAALKLIASETKRLAALDQAAIAAAAQTLANAQAAVAARNLAQAEAGLAASKKAVKGGLYLASLEKSVADLKTQLQAEAAAARKTESEKALELIDAAKGAPADAASTANPLARMMEQKKATAAKGEDEKSPPASGSKPRSTTAPAPLAATTPPPSGADSDSDGGGIGFQTIIIGIAVILALVTGGALFMQKRKG